MSDSTQPAVAAIAISILLLLAAGAGPAGASAASGGTVDAGAAVDSESASLRGGDYRVTRGDPLNITVVHSSTARLHLTDGEGYHLSVLLNGTGSDTVSIDTYNASGPAESYVSGGDPTLHGTPLTRSLAATEYTVNVTVDGVEQDLDTAVVEPRTPMNASSYVAPGTVDLSEGGVGALESSLTPRRRVAKGDFAAFRINESGLETALNASDLSGGAAAEGIRVAFTETTSGPNREPVSFDANHPSVTVSPRLARDEVLLAWNTSNVTLSRGPRTFEVRVTLVAEHNDLVEQNRTVANATMTVAEPAVSISSPTDFVAPPGGGSLPVTGETNLAPGHTVQVRARANTAEDTFLRKNDVTVGSGGRFSTTFDFGDVTAGTSFPAWALGYREQSERTVRIPSARANVTFADQETEGGSVTVRSVDLPAGGFVVVSDGERRLGASKLLSPGDHRRVTVPLDPTLENDTTLRAAAYFDGDGNGSFDPAADAGYAPANDTVADAANVTLPDRSTPATTATPTATPTPTPTPYPVATEAPLTPATETNGPLSPLLAVVAVLLAGRLLARHD